MSKTVLPPEAVARLTQLITELEFANDEIFCSEDVAVINSYMLERGRVGVALFDEFGIALPTLEVDRERAAWLAKQNGEKK